LDRKENTFLTILIVSNLQVEIVLSRPVYRTLRFFQNIVPFKGAMRHFLSAYSHCIMRYWGWRQKYLVVFRNTPKEFNRNRRILQNYFSAWRTGEIHCAQLFALNEVVS
jgi:hypothetical protein